LRQKPETASPEAENRERRGRERDRERETTPDSNEDGREEEAPYH
jgi:hypothetical protein